MSAGFALIPPDLVDKVLGNLSFRELSSVVFACKFLREGVSRKFSSTVSVELAHITNARTESEVLCRMLGRTLPRFQSLGELDLSRSSISDALFTVLASNSLSCLTKLKLVACPHLTDEGVRAAAEACPRLRYVDLTFSNGTTFASAIYLKRDRDVQVVQRLPDWLQGKFVCPWGEIHTYYADGSFEFTRDEESKGFVTTLEEHNGFVQDSLQYIDQPPWWPSTYKSGVLLKQIPELPDEVLVAQRIQSLDPLTEFPEISLQQLQVGTTQILEEQLAMVSRMQVTRFQLGEGTTAPAWLTDQILAYMSGEGQRARE